MNSLNILNETKNLILNTLVKVLFYFVLPLLTLSLLRVPKIGFIPVMYLHIFLGITVAITFFCRRKINYNNKTYVILLFFYLIGLGSMFTFTRVINAIPAFIMGLMFTTIFFERKKAHTYQLFDKDNNPIQILGSFQDITERKNAEIAKDTFLATMSHEMRTPLTAVIGMNELLQETNLTSKQSEYTKLIENGGIYYLQLFSTV